MMRIGPLPEEQRQALLVLRRRAVDFVAFLEQLAGRYLPVGRWCCCWTPSSPTTPS